MKFPFNISKIRSLFAALLLAVLPGCTFLDEEPISTPSEEKIYSTEKGVRAIITGCYHTLSSTNYWGWNMTELCGNSGVLLSKQGQNATWWTAVVGSADPNDSQYLYPFYTAAYQIINNANGLLENIDQCPLTDQTRREIIAEAKFLRGWAYFDLVRIFGRVPLVVERSSADRLHEPRASLRAIYEQIVDDFSDAWELPKKGSEQLGHPHRWASKAMLAKVYVQMGCLTPEYFSEDQGRDDPAYTDEERDGFWQLAYDNAYEVFTSGAYSLMPEFAQLWNKKSQNTMESIFELQYGNNSASLNFYTVRTLGPQFMLDKTTQTYTINYAPKVTTNTNNWGRLNVAKSTFAENWLKYGNGKGLKQIASNREEGCDPRINTTYLYYSDAYPEFNRAPTVGIWPSTSFGVSVNGMWPYIKKYWYDEFTGISDCVNVILYRYADLILLLAEAANELGQTEEAIGYVNDYILARARRYVDADGVTRIAPQPADWDLTMTQDEVRTAIMWERQFELLGEGQENFDTRRRPEYMREVLEKSNFWYDVARQALTNTELYEEGGWGKTVANNNVLVNAEVRYNQLDAEDQVADNFLRKILFFPFPRMERTLNKAIPSDDQNFGWDI